MVAIRRYGPVQGAGTTLTEKLAGVTILPSPLGVVAWSGILEKGPTNELIEVLSKSDMERQTGGRIPDSFMPDCNQDFWLESRGAGRQFLVRVTDGTEVKSQLTVKSRESTGVGFGRWRDLFQVDAKSGGRWAGARKRLIGEITGSGDLTETTIDTGLTMLLDEWSGATLQMTGIAGETFSVTGNTAAGVVTVKGDSQLLTKFGASVENEYILYKDNLNTLGQVRNVELVFKDGARNPVDEFGLEVYWNEEIVLSYADLSMDPNSDVYFVNVINDDTGNYEIEVTDLFSGSYTTYTRPANQSGLVQATLTETVLPLEWYQTWEDSGNTGDGTVSSVTVKASTQKDFITLTCNDTAVPGSEIWTVTSVKQDRTFDDATTAVAYVGPNDYFIDFTITTGATPFVVGDKLYIEVETIVPEEAIKGRVFYNTTDKPRDSLEIVDATVSTVTVRAGNDLTAVSAEGKGYRLQYRESLVEGYDGHSGVVDNDYIAVYDPDNSLFNRMANKKLGLIKYAVPGVSSTDVQKAARTYAEANNGPYREEIPSNIVTEVAAIEWVEDTMGQNDFAQVILPSWYYVKDPDKDVGLKLIPVVGAVQGVEALTARAWGGYHKAAAGESAVLSRTVKLPTGKKVLDSESTNPKGLQIILKKSGSWVIWGDRVPATSTGLNFKHQREQLSNYERVLFENFDWIMFAINDAETQDVASGALYGYFRPEWKPKRALRGNTQDEAFEIKIDSENNTDATRATGDLNAEIKLRLADTVERFNLIISPKGITEVTV
jgi:hypothetical protein